MAQEVYSMSWIEELGDVYKKRGGTYFLDVHTSELEPIWHKLKDQAVTRISSMTVNDCGKELEVIYHFVSGSDIINIKTRGSSRNPKVKSIVHHFPGAELIERELWETMGLEPVGHPDLRNFLLDKKLSPKNPGRRNHGY
jgi:NADH:ubiquinone oxidoreductase subunit C